jgi:hypothetical protein
VALHLGLDGRVQDASVVQSALLDVNGRKAVLEAALKQFETASLRAARRFRFDLTVRDGATPTADDLTVHVPFGFFLGPYSKPKPAEWRLFVRSPMQRPAWLPADARLALGVEDIADDEMRGGQNGPRLLTPIGPGAAL